MTMWKKIKHWLGISRNYLVCYNYVGKNYAGCGRSFFKSDIILDMNLIKEWEKIIKNELLMLCPELEDVEVAINNIIKLER